MRNELGSSPRPTAHPREDRLPTRLEPWKRLAPARPSQLSDWPTRTPPCGQLHFDLETASPSGMLRSQGRLTARSDPCASRLRAAPSPRSPPWLRTGAGRRAQLRPPGALEPPCLPAPPDTSRVLPGIQASTPLPSRVPGFGVPSGEPHPT